MKEVILGADTTVSMAPMETFAKDTRPANENHNEEQTNKSYIFNEASTMAEYLRLFPERHIRATSATMVSREKNITAHGE